MNLAATRRPITRIRRRMVPDAIDSDRQIMPVNSGPGCQCAAASLGFLPFGHTGESGQIDCSKPTPASDAVGTSPDETASPAVVSPSDDPSLPRLEPVCLMRRLAQESRVGLVLAEFGNLAIQEDRNRTDAPVNLRHASWMRGDSSAVTSNHGSQGRTFRPALNQNHTRPSSSTAMASNNQRPDN